MFLPANRPGDLVLLCIYSSMDYTIFHDSLQLACGIQNQIALGPLLFFCNCNQLVYPL